MKIIIDPINHNFGFKKIGLPIIKSIAPNDRTPKRAPITVRASDVDAL